MTVSELTEQLKAQPQDLDVIVLWHGYQRNLISVELVTDAAGTPLVKLIDEPRRLES